MKHAPKLTVLFLCTLLSSCADDDMALFGALATGAASGYAQANGDAAGAASLLETQQQILNEQANTDAANESSSSAAPTSYVTAQPVPGRSGTVLSPHSGKMVNVEGIAGGTLVEDPTTPNARFRVPQSQSAGRPGASSSGTGIAGTWINSKMTWVLDSDGSGRLIVPSNNGVATTYMNYQIDPDGGTFAYTLTRSTLTGTLNCSGDTDYEITSNKSYTENYKLSGNTLTIGTEMMTRN